MQLGKLIGGCLQEIVTAIEYRREPGTPCVARSGSHGLGIMESSSGRPRGRETKFLASVELLQAEADQLP
jgi:hypothetical protein